MPKNNKQLYIILFSLITLTLVAFFFSHIKEKRSNPRTPALETNTPSPLEHKSEEQGVSKVEKSSQEVKPEAPNPSSPKEVRTEAITIIAGKERTHLPISPGTLFYDALVEGREKGLLSFDGKAYPGLGFLVTSIGPLSAGDGKDLLYYINEQSADVGVSTYTLQDGDIIEWKLE